jgi:hypothetical protein
MVQQCCLAGTKKPGQYRRRNLAHAMTLSCFAALASYPISSVGASRIKAAVQLISARANAISANRFPVMIFEPMQENF